MSEQDQPEAAPSSKFRLRALTEGEIERLKKALGEPVDRPFLVHWVSQAIRDVVRMPTQPTPRECRDDFLQIVRNGRQWLEQIDGCPGKIFLEQHINLSQFTSAVTQFCDQAEGAAKHIGGAVKAGHPRIPFALEAFLDRMIGIAKKAKVLPSTPSRELHSQTAPRDPPAFFSFVREALAIGMDVIESSTLPKDRKEMALEALDVKRDTALIKALVKLRGPMGKYRQTKHGLVED